MQFIFFVLIFKHVFVAMEIRCHKNCVSFLCRHVNNTSTGGFAYFKAVSEIDGNNFTLIKYGFTT